MLLEFKKKNKAKNSYTFTWENNTQTINWEEVSSLYKIAPLGNKAPEALEKVFNNSIYKYFIYDDKKLIGLGRALADGVDCSYICDVAIHPEYQGIGLGKEMIKKLVADSQGHTKIILYSVATKEAFYAKLGFSKMKTAMALFKNQDRARDVGLIE